MAFDHDEELLVPLVGAEYFDGKFSETERDAVDQTLDQIRDMTATEASDYSHGEVGWIIAEDGETIPYEAAYLVSERDDELNRVIDRAFAAWVRNRDVDDCAVGIRVGMRLSAARGCGCRQRYSAVLRVAYRVNSYRRV